MSVIICPKCGNSQPIENLECVRCGVIFKKLLQPKAAEIEVPPDIHEPPPDTHEPPATIITQNNFLPEIGLKENFEVSMLNVIAYIYLIAGVAAGIGMIVKEKQYDVGLLIITAAVVTSMFLFVFYTIAKKIISIDYTLSYIARLITPPEKKDGI